MTTKEFKEELVEINKKLKQHNFQCCQDKREHNRQEALTHDPPHPLLCNGEFTMIEEIIMESKMNDIPTSFQEAYFFEAFAEQVEQQAIDNGINEAEAK